MNKIKIIPMVIINNNNLKAMSMTNIVVALSISNVIIIFKQLLIN